LLGNTSSRPNESALETVFGKFGPLDSVKVFPGKTYALVSFKEVAPAAEAMQCLDGHSLLSVSGQHQHTVHQKEKQKSAPFGVSSMKSQILHGAAQVHCASLSEAASKKMFTAGNRSVI
jgi:hypothetical protein